MPGVASTVIAVGTLVYGIIEGGDQGWTEPLAGNCHPNRDTLAAFRAAGLTLTDLDDFPFGAWPLRLRHVLGMATKH